ncbi:hypothetical protein [Streptococcus ruminantium]|uniref:hypothetical protein n=1 Tax=Streptococcus ruminantium TaxID=1917441 RepID=UPI0012DCDB1F|nr:hypothetical protein [Streptococcus ruminantium]BDD41932.1 hypothetical protein GUT189_02650 [Streptococcus ruminantium]
MEQKEILSRNIREQEEQLDIIAQEKYKIQWYFEEEREKLIRTNSKIQRELDEIYQATLQDVYRLTKEDWIDGVTIAQRILDKYNSVREEIYHEKNKDLI